MNIPPTDGIHVPVEDLRCLVRDIYTAVPIPVEHARLIADLLIDTELRGVVSHGVMQVERKERDYLENGIPISANAAQSLKKLAEEFGLTVSW